MNRTAIKDRRSGFTAVDLLITLAGVALVLMFMWPATSAGKSSGVRLQCMAHQKQIGLAFRMWANEHNDQFPMAIPIRKGGARGFAQIGQPLPAFRAISNELTKPKLPHCPNDKERRSAETFSTLAEKNLSYFLGIDAVISNPQLILAGDRNVTLDGKQASPGLIAISDPLRVGWSRSIHKDQGFILFTDGSAAQVNATALQRQLQATRVQTTRFAVP